MIVYRRGVAGALILMGAGLRCWQYFANRSLWVDEAALASNIFRPLAAGLTEGFDNLQVAPPGFVLAERASVALLGTSELALRLFPLLCSLAALAVFYRLAQRALGDDAATYALAFFAFNRWLIFYASDLKQYSSDVLAAAILLLAALTMVQETATRARAARLALIGAVAGVFSYAALIVAFGIFATALLVPTSKFKSTSRRSLGAVALVWTASAGLSVLWSLRLLPPNSRRLLPLYWTLKGGLPASAGAVPRWTVRALAEAFAFLFDPSFMSGRLQMMLGIVGMLLAAAGALRLLRVRPTETVLLLGPLAAALGAAAIRRYPFAGRLILYLFPSMLILIAGVFAGPWPSRARSRVASAAACIFGIAFAARSLSIVPEHSEEMRSVVARLKFRAVPGDTLWVYSSAQKALSYYAMRVGLTATEARIGCRAPTGWEHYVEEARNMTGTGRVWVIVTHLPDPEADFIRRCFDLYGNRETEISDRGASATLYRMHTSPQSSVEALLDSIPEERRHGELDVHCADRTTFRLP